MSLEIKDGKIIARVPNVLTQQETVDFITKHADWIFRKWKESLVKKENRQTYPVVPVSELTKEEIERIQHKFMQKIQRYAAIMHVTYGRVTIRNQKTRWGSCSAKGNLNFNYQLYYFPEEWMDYVIIHELAHRIHMNHSKEFWQEVERYCPNYREYRNGLKQIGSES